MQPTAAGVPYARVMNLLSLDLFLNVRSSISGLIRNGGKRIW